MQKLSSDTDVEQGDTIRVEYDGESVTGEVREVKHDGDKIVIDGDDGTEYVLYRPMIASLGFDFDEGGAIDGSQATRLSDDPDTVEVLK